jgi:hypothetical protein
MGHLLGGSSEYYYDKTKIEEKRKDYARLIFTPVERVKIDVLEPLRGMARVLGINVAQLEESKQKELGRPPTDIEKLNMLQESIKNLLSQVKTISESNNEEKPVEDILDEKSSDNAELTTHARKQQQLDSPKENMPRRDVEPEESKSKVTTAEGKHQEKNEIGKVAEITRFQNGSGYSTFLFKYNEETWGKTLGKLVLSLGRHSGDVKAFYYLLSKKEAFKMPYSKFEIKHNGNDTYEITVPNKDLAELLRKKFKRPAKTS